MTASNGLEWQWEAEAKISHAAASESVGRTVFFSTCLLKKPQDFLMPEAIAWIRPRWYKMALLLSWTSEEKGQGNIIMPVICMTHWSVTEARVSCTDTNQLNCLALIRVITLSTTVPLFCSLQKLWPAMTVGWNYTQANSSIGDGLRVDCTYTTWCQTTPCSYRFYKRGYHSSNVPLLCSYLLAVLWQ